VSHPVAPVPRVALTREEAAASLGVSLDSFERHCQPTMRLVRLGRLVLVPVSELDRWLKEQAAPTLTAEQRSSVGTKRPSTAATAEGQTQRGRTPR